MNCFSVPTGNARALDRISLCPGNEGDRARFREAFHVSLRAPGWTSAGPRSSDSLEKKFRGKIDDGKKSWEKKQRDGIKERKNTFPNGTITRMNGMNVPKYGENA